MSLPLILMLLALWSVWTMAPAAQAEAPAAQAAAQAMSSAAQAAASAVQADLALKHAETYEPAPQASSDGRGNTKQDELDALLGGEFDGASLVFSSMRTKCEILVPRLSGSNLGPDFLAEEAKKAVLRVAELLSPSGEGSDLNRINQSRPGRLITVDPLTMRAIIEAWSWRELSGGLFEPALGPVKKLYRFNGQTAEKLPEGAALKEALDLTGKDAIFFDEKNFHVSKRKAAVALDFGAIGKGLAADLAAEALSALGVRNALINLGGEMRIMGQKPLGQDFVPWTVEITDPAGGAGQYVIEASDQAIATSGNYESYLIFQGRRLSHLIDPATGLPAESGAASATVIHPSSAAAADVLATVACLLGPNRIGPWLEERQEVFPDGVSIVMLSEDDLGELSASYYSLSATGKLTEQKP